ncbi:helix-turn-helix domain-containing protein [Nitrospina watsonii]|uniref:Helix-turn-helix motif protein (Modular protein) n=1 Tax=Nitrospina watsonii TaxID=1323948 RepID=A0ABM9HDE5_9BACT|nr:helix-turn-helix transcriptional regulator [Nitrospina watsonii]CAI2718088.1 Putative helix-turn-helix motif protein (Modular protein) [Nitrospina watsonii]
MSILAQNMRTIRKELKCTQSAMADILKVGFRTYVRYEAGERDAPVAILIKMARLGNISLEQLLTQKVDRFNIAPVNLETFNMTPPLVKSANFRTGHIVFKKPARETLLTLDESEKKVLSLFRKMSSDEQNRCLKTIESHYKPSSALSRSVRTDVVKTLPEAQMFDEEPQAMTKKPRFNRPRKRGRPGRTREDKKLLREKIDRLKKITKTAPKITVR